MKIYRNENVLDAARRRMRWLFEEFREVSVTISGGKDSIVCYNLALEAARELDMLPLKVMFIDQEAVWECVIDQVQYMMYHPDVEPYWYQMPIRMSNATSTYEQWLRAWDPDQEDVWMREKDPISIKENNFDTDRFHDLFKAISYDVHPWGGADIVGLRGEEAPTRLLALTTGMDYHGVTWFSHQTRVNQKSEWEDRIYRYAFYPIYDWTYSDVWKAIHDHGWKYPSVYDSMYQHGVPIRNMRVSHLHHEEAVGTLRYLQEIEPQTWEKLTRRIQGIDAYSKIGFEKITLPYMFKDWKEYRDYLLPRLIEDPEFRIGFDKMFKKHDRDWVPYLGDEVLRLHVDMILKNDWEGALLKQYSVKANKKLKSIRASAV